MEELHFFLRVILAVVLLSSAWSKLRNMQEHIFIIEDYKILPFAIVPAFAWGETLLELGAGVLLLTDLFYIPALGIAASLFFVYSIAIAINLMRGRTEISCGCGGVTGDHDLSWWLVLRNGLLILLSIIMLSMQGTWASLEAIFSGATWGDVFPYQVLPTFLAAVVMLMLLSAMSDLATIRQQIKEILHSQKPTV